MDNRAAAQFAVLKSAALFGTNNLPDFNPLASQLLLDLTTPETGLLDQISRAATTQDAATGHFHGGTLSKAQLRQALRRELRKINRTAAAIAEATARPSLMAHFRMPRPCGDTALAAKARAMADAAQPMATEFIAYAHPDTFVEDLRTLIETFAQAEATQGSGSQHRSGATAELKPLLKLGMLKVRQLDAFVHNFYEANPQKLGEWKSASHLKRQPKRTKPSAVAPAVSAALDVESALPAAAYPVVAVPTAQPRVLQASPNEKSRVVANGHVTPAHPDGEGVSTGSDLRTPDLTTAPATCQLSPVTH